METAICHAIHSLQVYDAVVFSVLSELCLSHHRFRKISHYTKHAPLLAVPQVLFPLPLAITGLFSVSGSIRAAFFFFAADNNTPFTHLAHLFYPFLSSLGTGLFAGLGTGNNAAMNIDVQELVWIYVFISVQFSRSVVSDSL